MDPTANLLEQERIIVAMRTSVETPRFHDMDRLSELRNALTAWLENGGFEPDWTLAPKAKWYFSPILARIAPKTQA